MSFITDETLRNLMAQAGLNPNRVQEGIDMAVQQQLSPQQQYQQELQQTWQSAQAAAPPINVRVKEVEPPVVLKGTLELTITFPYDSLIGLPEEEVKQRIFQVIMGASDGGTWLPAVQYGNMDVWREVVRERPAAGPVGESNPGPSFKRAVRRVSDPDDSGRPSHLEHRDAEHDEPGEPAEA